MVTYKGIKKTMHYEEIADVSRLLLECTDQYDYHLSLIKEDFSRKFLEIKADYDSGLILKDDYVSLLQHVKKYFDNGSKPYRPIFAVDEMQAEIKAHCN